MFVNMVRNDEKEIAYRRSNGVRNAIMLILAGIDAGSYLFFAEQIRQIPVGDNEYVWCFPILMVVILNFVGLKYAGPNDLVLDIDRQAYTHTTGYPMFPKTISGSFGDFYALCVRPVKNRRGAVVTYRVELDWNTPDIKPLILSECTTIDQAYEQQHLLAHRLISIPVAKD